MNPALPTLLDKVLSTVRRHGMFGTGDTVVVAVSGGPDSVALLHALAALAPELRLSLVVAHLDHAIRADEAQADASFVEALARDLGLAYYGGREGVPALARREHRSLEEAGRVARRRFLREVADRAGARRVALGHNRDDQAESVLLRLVTGAGRAGLSGIKPVADGLFVRPLLDCAREEIVAFLNERAIPFRTDPSNQDPRFTRNRLRLRVLPLLRDEFNPQVAEAIARSAGILRDEDRYLDRAARRAMRKLLVEAAPSAAGLTAGQPPAAGPARETGRSVPAGSSIVVLDATALASLTAAIARRVVRLALRRAGLAGRDLAHARIEEILAAATRGGNLDLTPGGGVHVRLEYGRLLIETGARESVPAGSDADGACIDEGGAGRSVPGEAPASAKDPRKRLERTGAGPDRARPGEPVAGVLEIEIPVPGEATLAPPGVRIAARVVPRETIEAEYHRAPAHRVYLDADTLAGPLRLREPRPGDRFHPLGGPGSRKLSDLFTDLKLPRADRLRCLVAEAGGTIVWVVGLRAAESCRITESTSRVTILEAQGALPLQTRAAPIADIATGTGPRAAPVNEYTTNADHPREPEQSRYAGSAASEPRNAAGPTAPVFASEPLTAASSPAAPANADGPPSPARSSEPHRPATPPSTPGPPPAVERVLFTPVEIAQAVDQLGREIAEWAGGGEIIVLGVLHGSFIFIADLVRRLPGPVRVGFLDRAGDLVRGCPPLGGARVLLVEDILDTGESLSRILDRIAPAGPSELRTCVLFDKPSGRKLAIEADFRGLLVPDRWVVGYGLDLDNLLRNLPYLAWA